MGVKNRKAIITTIEQKLNARLITLVWGDRQHLETKMAPDILPLISDLLTGIGSAEKIALFLYTRGGDSIVGWSLVNLGSIAKS